MSTPTHLLHMSLSRADSALSWSLECVGHSFFSCGEASYDDDIGAMLHIEVDDPACPIPVAFAPIRWEGDPAELDTWDDDGPIIVRDPRVAS